MFAWRSLPSSNLLLAFEWLTSRRGPAAPAAKPATGDAPAKPAPVTSTIR